MTNGILIMATGKPYYGRMAFNLAASIKAVEPEMKICVVNSGRGLQHLNEQQKGIFDVVLEYTHKDFKCGNKLFAYEYTPFDRTLMIDADNVWFPKRLPSKLFDELRDVKFTGITEGCLNIEHNVDELRKDYFTWSDPNESIKAYGLTGKYYQWRSEVLFFEKCDEVEAMFTTAQNVYAQPKVHVMGFGGGLPDEFALNIAASIHGIEPHKYQWQPCYWDRIHKKPLPMIEKTIYQDYWLMSTGGNHVSSYTTKLYNRIVKAACYKLGLQFLFTLQSKKSALEERQKM